jgi:hypothetical protein
MGQGVFQLVVGQESRQVQGHEEKKEVNLIVYILLYKD